MIPAVNATLTLCVIAHRRQADGQGAKRHAVTEGGFLAQAAVNLGFLTERETGQVRNDAFLAQKFPADWRFSRSICLCDAVFDAGGEPECAATRQIG